jgi:hypothetical protein
VTPSLLTLTLGTILCLATLAPAGEDAGEEIAWGIAAERAGTYADCGRQVRRLLQGWLDRKQDPQTALFSRGGVWDYHDEAADHYSSLVLMGYYTAPWSIERGGPLHRTLVSSQQLCATPSGLPATYDLRSGRRGDVATLAALAEWQRDGLIRIVEVMGRDNDWYGELVRLTKAMLAEARRRGALADAFSDPEARGNLLQTLARLYAMSGDQAYLTAAEELADAALADPRLSEAVLRFEDHGCELVPGLAELFALQCRLDRTQGKRLHEPLRDLLDAILRTSAHPETGLLGRPGRPQDGQPRWPPPPDTWGYVLFAFENYDRATGENRYRDAVAKPMRWLMVHRHRYHELKHTRWPRSISSDDWSDSYESMLVLWNRYPETGDATAWLDWATLQHKHRRYPDRKYGPFEGGHFDGSTGRTLCLHMMLCSQGLRAAPFLEGLGVGALQRDGELLLIVQSSEAWSGRLYFDHPRNEYPTATIDWARINEMPAWFVARPEVKYTVRVDAAEPVRLSGRELIDGLPMTVRSGGTRRIRITAEPGNRTARNG